jgi:hypothetical protein
MPTISPGKAGNPGIRYGRRIVVPRRCLKPLTQFLNTPVSASNPPLADVKGPDRRRQHSNPLNAVLRPRTELRSQRSHACRLLCQG